MTESSQERARETRENEPMLFEPLVPKHGHFVLRFVTHKLKLEGLKFFRCTLICVHWVNKKNCRNQMIYNLYKDTIILNGSANKTSPKGKKIILNFWSRKKLNNMCAFDQKNIFMWHF